MIETCGHFKCVQISVIVGASSVGLQAEKTCLTDTYWQTLHEEKILDGKKGQHEENCTLHFQKLSSFSSVVHMASDACRHFSLCRTKLHFHLYLSPHRQTKSKPSCNLFLWFDKPAVHLKDMSHMLHLYGAFPPQLWQCCTRFFLEPNVFPQLWHWKGLTSEWTFLLWYSKSFGLLNVRPHPGTGHSTGCPW